jgi:hypothetical protein
VSYAAAKGNAATAPAVNNNEIRIYQNGGTLTITGNNGKKINSITIGSSMKTSVSYKIDGGTESSAVHPRARIHLFGALVQSEFARFLRKLFYRRFLLAATH